MRESIPWRKAVKCWKSSEHPSVRIKDKVRQWPHVLGDTSFYFKPHFTLNSEIYAFPTGKSNSGKSKCYAWVTSGLPSHNLSLGEAFYTSAREPFPYRAVLKCLR